MSVTAVIGMQWGDEGKGKIVDAIGEDTDIVARCQGGGNAGHTVVIGEDIFKLHLIPSGILRKNAVAVIGNGVVLDPQKTITEIEGLNERGIETEGRLLISDRAHIVMPYHKILDGLRESARGAGNLGTTRQGIGPTYGDKAARCGLRGHHLQDAEKFPTMLKNRIAEVSKYIEYMGGEPLNEEEILAEVIPAADKIRPYITDTVAYLQKALAENKKILLEGAQGAMLDIDFGTYPYLTSSNTTTGGCSTGSGIPPWQIKEVHGVIKAFTTRVGTGPFPTELSGEAMTKLGGTGENHWDEFGTTTGRPRRCGWLDLVVGRYSAQINGVTHLHITKMDIMSQFDEIKICVAYELNGKRIDTYPASLDLIEHCKPIYETIPGWNSDITGCNSIADLPEGARKYLDLISEYCGAKVVSAGFGPAREHTLF